MTARATYQDILDAPENMVAELLDGVLHLQPRPRDRHGAAMSNLGAVLTVEFSRAVGRVGGWVLRDEPELHFDEDVLVPDIAAWRAGRFPEDAGDLVGIRIPPDWVCEVLSPTTARHDRARKLPRYARAGVTWAWLVDPEIRVVEVYRRAEPLWQLVRVVDREEPAALEPFESFELPLDRLWEG